MTIRGEKEKQLENAITADLKKKLTPYESYRELPEEELFAEAAADESDA